MSLEPVPLPRSWLVWAPPWRSLGNRSGLESDVPKAFDYDGILEKALAWKMGLLRDKHELIRMGS